MKTITFLASLLFIISAEASIFDSEYLFDGSPIVSNYWNELSSTGPASRNTLTLSHTALAEYCYRGFSSLGWEANANLDFTYPGSCGFHASNTSYAVSINGGNVLSGNDLDVHQKGVHLDFHHIDFSVVSTLDEFSISHALASSIASEKIIASYADGTWWQHRVLFDSDKVSFKYPVDTASDVPEPASMALLVLGVVALGWFRFREAAKNNKKSDKYTRNV